VVPSGVSYLLALEGSLGRGDTRTSLAANSGLDTASYLPAGVVKPAAVSYRSLVLSDLRDGMLWMDDNVGGKSGRGRLGDDGDETEDPG
jgi:hypothetical protein